MRLTLSLKRRRADEASAWYARLNGSVVAHKDLEAFRRWRRKPGADAAYTRIETTWRRLEPLRSDPDIHAWMGPPAGGAAPGGLTDRTPLLFGLGAGLALASAAALLWMADGSWGARYTTPVAGHHVVTLADGTTILLDASTRLRVHLDARSRRLRLDQGRILVDVAHDPKRPFVVEAGDARVVALGTRFTVRRDHDAAEVVLLRGRVQVREPSSSRAQWTLSPGQAVSARANAPTTVDVASALGWTQGRIILQAVTPGDAVAEINRYAPHPLRLAPELAHTAPVSGVFQAGDPEAFAAALTRLRGWRATRQADGSVLLTTAPPPDAH